LIPGKFVDHTHADAAIAVMNTPGGEARAREIYGPSVVIVPYLMPGFKLARACADLLAQPAAANATGMILMNHGVFSWGDTAKLAYERMIDLVSRAEAYLASRQAWDISLPAPAEPPQKSLRAEIAALRRAVSLAAGTPLVLQTRADEFCLAFARRPDVAEITQRGTATPDHVIRTKRTPMIGRDAATYSDEYARYFDRNCGGQNVTKLDGAPRVILDKDLGLCLAGHTAKDARIAGDIYRQTMDIILRAEALGGWRALPEADLFEMEYWELEQAKIKRAGKPAVFSGETALITGAASGIGKACALSFLSRGAAVIGLDVNPSVASLHQRPDYLGVVCDLTSRPQIADAVEAGARAFGGLDMLVLNAGVFHKSCPIADMPDDLWRKVININLDANLALLRECHPLLKLAPKGGRVAVIGSKNVPAPGPGAAAYSASKAAMNQLARVAALEWGADNIRVNSVHPNQVFDTGLWSPEILESRAQHYGLTVEQYKTNNVLHAEVKSSDVAELAAEMCGPLFAKTTGAQVPVDGGNERVI
jgi:NAD(P)-dependent dehydrogenase (short-subunit alcohol dehydrogenase family)